MIMIRFLKLPVVLAILLLPLAQTLALPVHAGDADAHAGAPDWQTLADVPPLVKAPTDTATFRRFVLDNGMKVLLVSDPKFNKSAAALSVHTGQIDDPKEREGLAHFLEHMLFLGTEKYPDVSEYGNFIQANGGYHNASTSSAHSNYHFEVRHDAFPQALDRFAQFFIAPLFNADFTSREVNAVHSEAMRHVQNDLRRMISVSRELYDPSSGESKFSTGNKDTLAGANATVVRAFYESHYSADRMAVALTGKVSLDELEKLARETFSKVPKRGNLSVLERESKFLPKKPALRLALIEPIKEIRQLSIEFPVPSTRPDFLSHPDVLVSSLIGTAAPGGLESYLKKEGLINNVGASLWERSGNYGSMFIGAELTPAGYEQYPRVLQTIFAYLKFLRDGPFPAEFYNERAKIAQLNETYLDRGEGANLAAGLANNALFYPLEIAERAGRVWGRPDPAAYKRLLAALTPDNALVSLAAKGVSTNKRERIYDVAYSYSEDAGNSYRSLLSPPRIAAFTLPTSNPYMPDSAKLLAERPLRLIDEPGLSLYYAQDVEFQRPQTTLIYRFVPTRDVASADSLALLRLYEASLMDFLEPIAGEASRAGVSYGLNVSLEGFRLTVTGYGDSPRRFADAVAARLFDFEVTPQRYAAIKEATLRGLKSYEQTEAYALARDRRDALMREFHYLPTELIARTDAATWSEVQSFGRRFFAKGRIEALVHGHMNAGDAVTVTRSFASKIAAAPAAPDALLRRRHLAIPGPEDIVDAAEINGVNSAFYRDYVLPDDSPATRAAAQLVANFFSSPFYSELRTKQQLGYVVISGAESSQRHRYLSFIVQSSVYPPDEVKTRAEKVIATLPSSLAAISDAEWNTLVAGVRASFEEKSKSIPEKAEMLFANAYLYDGDWDRRQAPLDALAALRKEDAVTLLTNVLMPGTARQRTVMLYTKAKPPAERLATTFANRESWKSTRQFQ